MKTKSISVLFGILAVAFIGLTACTTSPITAVTPIPLQSLDITAVERLGENAQAVTADTAAATAPFATPTPFAIHLPEAELLKTLMAQDAALKLEPREGYVQVDEDVPLLYFWELFDGYDPETGLILSDKAISLDGRQVTMLGFMAPPLQVDLSWFQLTLTPIGACPFCTSAQTVVPDMITVYPVNNSVLYSLEPVRVTGRFEVGAASDPETGMFSLARIYAEEVETGVSLE